MSQSQPERIVIATRESRLALWQAEHVRDRLLIAQALEEKLPVVTADPIFRKYGVKRIW